MKWKVTQQLLAGEKLQLQTGPPRRIAGAGQGRGWAARKTLRGKLK
jgi:hypothetical protein